MVLLDKPGFEEVGAKSHHGSLDVIILKHEILTNARWI
jgi:hypothetical protein